MAGLSLTGNPVDAAIEAHRGAWLAMRHLLTTQDPHSKAMAQTIGVAAQHHQAAREEVRSRATRAPKLDVACASAHDGSSRPRVSFTCAGRHQARRQP